MSSTQTTIAALLTPDETARKLRVTVETLAIWRCTKRYPLPYVKVGRRVMYRPADVDAFIDSRTENLATAD